MNIALPVQYYDYSIIYPPSLSFLFPKPLQRLKITTCSDLIISKYSHKRELRIYGTSNFSRSNTKKRTNCKSIQTSVHNRYHRFFCQILFSKIQLTQIPFILALNTPAACHSRLTRRCAVYNIQKNSRSI